MDQFYIENKILIKKHIFNYNIGVLMFKYVNIMTTDVFDNFFRNVSDTYPHNTRNAANNLPYVTYRAKTRRRKTFWSSYLEFNHQMCEAKLYNWLI